MGTRPECYVDKTDEFHRDLLIPEHTRRILLEQNDQAQLESTIMEIFYSSVFYQKESNNEQLRTQLQTSGIQESLKEMKGIQFVVTQLYPEKNLFWIEKRNRTSPRDFTVISVYYMLNFTIFQAPTLSHIVDTRINNSIFFQKKAFEMI